MIRGISLSSISYRRFFYIREETKASQSFDLIEAESTDLG